MVVGISGASGIAYGIGALERLRALDVETHLVVSRAGGVTRATETDLSAAELAAMADFAYGPSELGAVIASGSFATLGMLVAPCSARSLAAIAQGLGDNLLTRAADVTLKERRRLVLMVRETPLTLGHIRSMAAVTESGGIVMPPVPALYAAPASVQELVDHSVARALDLFGFQIPVRRWEGIREPPSAQTVSHAKRWPEAVA